MSGPPFALQLHRTRRGEGGEEEKGGGEAGRGRKKREIEEKRVVYGEEGRGGYVSKKGFLKVKQEKGKETWIFWVSQPFTMTALRVWYAMGRLWRQLRKSALRAKNRMLAFPGNAIRYCLQEGKCASTDLRYIVFYDKPLVKFERLLETYLAFAPRGRRSFVAAMPVWLKEKLFLKDALQRVRGSRRGQKVGLATYSFYGAS